MGPRGEANKLFCTVCPLLCPVEAAVSLSLWPCARPPLEATAAVDVQCVCTENSERKKKTPVLIYR